MSAALHDLLAAAAAAIAERDALAARVDRLEEQQAVLVARLDALAGAPVDDSPQTLDRILGCTPGAARRREERVAGLRQLSVGTRGRRRLYLASRVRELLARAVRP